MRKCVALLDQVMVPHSVFSVEPAWAQQLPGQQAVVLDQTMEILCFAQLAAASGSRSTTALDDAMESRLPSAVMAERSEKTRVSLLDPR